jgi:hypothetical protein
MQARVQVDVGQILAAWERKRNMSRVRIKWMFTTEKARDKMGRAYPKLSTKESKSL